MPLGNVVDEVRPTDVPTTKFEGHVSRLCAREGPATLTIRPENIRLGPATTNSLRATLISRTYLGTQTRLLVQVEDVPLDVMVNPGDAAVLAINAELYITLPPQSLWLLP